MSHNVKPIHTPPSVEEMTQLLKEAGLRPTMQRLQLGGIIWGAEHRHITAECLLNETREQNIKVSLATIYNTLHQFTDAGLLKEIVVEGGRSYFDTNVEAHHHFLCEDTGMLMDIPGECLNILGIPAPPDGTEVTGVEVVVKVRQSAA